MDGRHLRLRRLIERLHGVEDDSYRATRDGFSPLLVIGVCGAMFIVIFALRMLDDSPGSGYALLFSIPVALLALRFGVKGGLIAAIVAEALFIVAAATVVDFEGALPYVTRATTFFTLGLLVGYLSERLAQNEARFVLALRSSSIFVFTMDRDLHYTWVYHGWGDRLTDLMIGKTDSDLAPPEYAGPIIALKRRALKGDGPVSDELPSVDREGKLRWFRISVEAARDPTGHITGLIGSALEVTELRDAYAELARNEERFRSAVENMIEPFALYSAVRDENGEITDFRCDYMNQPGADAVGMPASQMHGKLLSELYPGRLEYGLIDRYREVVETGEPHVREEIDYVNVFGEQTLVRGFDIRIARVGDGIEITWRDITARKREELDRDWSAAIVDASIDAIMSADTSGVIKSWSSGAERLYGWSSDEIVGRNFLQTLVPPELHSVRAEIFSRVAGGQSVGPVLSTELHKDGTRMRVAFTATPICDDGGEIAGVARIVRAMDPAPDYYTTDEDEAAAGRV